MFDSATITFAFSFIIIVTTLTPLWSIYRLPATNARKAASNHACQVQVSMSLSAIPTRDPLTRVFSMFDKTEIDVDMSYSTKRSWTSTLAGEPRSRFPFALMAMTATRQSRCQTKPYRDSPNPPNQPHGKARDHLHRLEKELSLPDFSTSNPRSVYCV